MSWWRLTNNTGVTSSHTRRAKNLTNSFSKLLKETIELQKKLSPSSKLHERQSVRDLQDAVQEVKAVWESLDKIPGSVKMKEQIQECWDRGWKWIFEKQE